LLTYYQLIFTLKQQHSWSVFEIEEMMPWEREVYVALLKQHIEEQNEKMKAKQK
tara:strand:+ start:198 stop:359 length:162 start_codon:yes stop_codon:yes gene_type:complete